MWEGEEEASSSSSMVGIGEGCSGESSVEAIISILVVKEDVLVLAGDDACDSVWMMTSDDDDTGWQIIIPLVGGLATP